MREANDMPKLTWIGVAASAAPLLTACQTAPHASQNLRLTPEQAVFNAAQSEAGTSGVFQMVVRATGRNRGRLFLNSQADYRDPRNLTIVISSEAEAELARRLGGPIDETLLKRAIAVRGTAKKTQIDFYERRGRPSGKYYFQTHVVLESARDLTVEGELPRA